MSNALDNSACAVHSAQPPLPPPREYWLREAGHAPLPWSVFHRDFLCDLFHSATAELYPEFGVPFEAVDYRVIGGWDYIRLVPLGGREPPRLPRWLASVAIGLAPPVRRRARTAAAVIRADLPGETLRNWSDQWRPELIARTATLRDIDPAGMDDTGLDAHLGEVLAFAEECMRMHLRLSGPIGLALAELAFTCRELLGWDVAQTLRLLVGTSEMSTAPARALVGLGDIASRHPDVRRLLEARAPREAVLAADPEFAAGFQAYQREYGCRALSYDVADPCLHEQPDLVLGLIRDQLTTGFDPDAAAAANRARRATTRDEANRALAHHPDVARDRFERALERALRAYPIREDNEFFTVSAPFGLVRRAAHEIGQRLTDRGLLDGPDDAFHLTAEQLRAALRDGLDCRAETHARAAERAWALAHPGPACYGPPPGPPPSLRWLPAEARLITGAMLWGFEHIFGGESITSPSAESGPLAGVAASPGSYTGPARIIRGEDDFDRLQAGDVLVCPATSPVWSVLFAGIGALVADGGGTLSHQAIIARECGIPAVVGTGTATTRLTDGQLITVDGATGTVQVFP